jgi:hypothetical protein
MNLNLRTALLASMFTLGVFASGCSNGDDDTGSASAGASAEARAKLSEFAGTWTVAERKVEAVPMPDRVLVTVTDEGVDQTTKVTKGTRLRLMREDTPSAAAVDRTPFDDIDEGEQCKTDDLGEGRGVKACHDSRLEGNALSHRVTTTATAPNQPERPSTATQTLTLEAGKLHYTYAINEDVVDDVFLTR